MSAKIQGIPHASAYAWRIPVHYFTVIAKIHPKSPAAMDFGTPESLPYGQREALSADQFPWRIPSLYLPGVVPLSFLNMRINALLSTKPVICAMSAIFKSVSFNRETAFEIRTS